MSDYAYDNVPYKSSALPQTHPSRIGAMAALFGMLPRPIDNCRILELGCGDGSNLIPMAYALHKSECIGVDLAEKAISEGNKIINDLGLSNIDLRHMNILDINSELGLFDYIIVHGIFSWVPHQVQEKIFSICKNNLAPRGVAYLSYNTYPGCHLRDMIRNIMQFHSSHFSEPKQMVAQGYSILKFIAESSPQAHSPYSKVLNDEVNYMQQMHADSQFNYLYYDYLSELNIPLYFHEFIARAEKHGLKYLAESNIFEMHDMFFKEDIRNTLQRLGGSDIIVKEQFMDFIKGRRFRMTLLCHTDIPLNRNLRPELMQKFYFNCPSQPVDENGKKLKEEISELLVRKDLKFQRSNSSTIETNYLLPRAALIHLYNIWPQSMPFKELLKTAQEYRSQYNSISPDEGGVPVDDAFLLGEMLLSSLYANIVEISCHAPHYEKNPGNRPTASEYARIQARSQTRVTNLCHKTIELGNSYAQYLIHLLDGTRDRQTIHKEMIEIIRQKNVPFEEKTPEHKSDEVLVSEIDQELMSCARNALLVA